MNDGKTKNVSLKTVIGRGMFVAAFKAAHDGKPFDYRYYDTLTAKEQWSYERGRHFAAQYAGPLKSGRNVKYEALAAAYEALCSGALV